MSDMLTLILAAERTYTSPDERSISHGDSEPSYNRDDVSTSEVLQLSKLPDAHQPSDEEIPAIERADWPAPPHPAAAYPELRKYSTSSRFPTV